MVHGDPGSARRPLAAGVQLPASWSAVDMLALSEDYGLVKQYVGEGGGLEGLRPLQTTPPRAKNGKLFFDKL